jgi:hypothetical protein
MRIFKIASALLLTAALTAGYARGAWAQHPPEDPQQMALDLKKVGEVAERHRADLMKIPHVTGVVAETDDENEAALLVEIDDPENTDDVTRGLPSQIEGFPVQVDVAVGDDDSDDNDNDDDSGTVKPRANAHSLAGGGIVAHDSGAKSSPTPAAKPGAAKN